MRCKLRPSFPTFFSTTDSTSHSGPPCPIALWQRMSTKQIFYSSYKSLMRDLNLPCIRLWSNIITENVHIKSNSSFKKVTVNRRGVQWELLVPISRKQSYCLAFLRNCLNLVTILLFLLISGSCHVNIKEINTAGRLFLMHSSEAIKRIIRKMKFLLHRDSIDSALALPHITSKSISQRIISTILFKRWKWRA